MKKYLLPKEGFFYKANLHTHTTVSDGRLTPEEIKETYLAQGYSIVAYTDHEVIVRHEDLRDEHFLPLTSTEIAISQTQQQAQYRNAKTYHLNLLSLDPEKTTYSTFNEDVIHIARAKPHVTDEMRKTKYARTYSVDCINDIIQKANEEGFLVAYNHPVWSLQDYSDYIGLRGLWGIEICNSECNSIAQYDTVRPWEELLRKGEHIFPLATDDCHNAGTCCKSWVMLKAPALEYDAVMSALKNGDFYASTGPQIKELTFEDGLLHIECSPAKTVYLTTDYRIGRQRQAEDVPLTSVDFDLSSYMERVKENANEIAYFRITVEDEKGNAAHSRAYFFDSL